MDRLLKLRTKRNFSQAEVALILGVSPQAYSMYETGKRQLSYEGLILLAELYNVTIDFLLGRDIEPSKLNNEEKQLLARYQTLHQDAKDTVKHLLHFEYTRARERAKKE